MMSVSNTEDVCVVWASYMQNLFGGEVKWMIDFHTNCILFKVENETCGTFIKKYYREDMWLLFNNLEHYMKDLKECYQKRLEEVWQNVNKK